MRTLSSPVLAALFLTACGGAPPPPPETAAAPPATADATKPKATAADDPAAKAAGVESLTAGEAKSTTTQHSRDYAEMQYSGEEHGMRISPMYRINSPNPGGAHARP